MKILKAFMAAFSIFLLLGLIGCHKKELQTVTSALTVVMNNKSQTLQKLEDKTVQFDSGYISISKVDIYGEFDDNNSNNNDNDFHSSVDINTKINLATGAYDVPINFDLLNTDYDDIKFNINLNSSNGYPSIKIHGTYTDVNGKQIPVVFIYKDKYTLKVELDDDYDNVDDDLNVNDFIPAFVIKISPSSWFKDVSSELLENATRYNGIILINDTANIKIYNEVVDEIGDDYELEVESRDLWEHEYHSDDLDD